MNDILGTGDDRDEKTDMAEGDIDDMVEANYDAELGMREGMTEMIGARDNSDEKDDMAEVNNEDELVGCGEMRKDDEMGNECQDERGGERGKDDNMGCDVHYDQGGGGKV